MQDFQFNSVQRRSEHEPAAIKIERMRNAVKREYRAYLEEDTTNKGLAHVVVGLFLSGRFQRSLEACLSADIMAESEASLAVIRSIAGFSQLALRYIADEYTPSTFVKPRTDAHMLLCDDAEADGWITVYPHLESRREV